MHTEKTDNQGPPAPRAWVGYDGDCGLCVGLLRRWGGPFERRGFVFVPLQNPWLAAALTPVGRAALPGDFTPEKLAGQGCPAYGDIPDEMKLLFPDGRIIGGAECVVVMMRTVWWLAPLAWLTWLPGLRLITKAAYRWVARNRHSLAICRLPARTGHPHHGHTAFFEMP